MGWEQRGNRRYYYRVIRSDGRPKKVYVGTGEVADAAAREDANRRAGLAVQRLTAAAVEARVAVAEAALDELGAWTSVLMRAVMLLAGYHEHHRIWRRRVFVA